MSLIVYLKNLAGDIVAVEAQSDWSEDNLLEYVTGMDPLRYLPGRTHILRSPGPLKAEEVVTVLVEVGPYVERWEEDGISRVRYVVPFEHGILHVRRILLYRTWVRFYAEQVYPARGPLSLQPQSTLYEAIRVVWPDVTPGDMRQIYSVVVPDVEQEAIRNGMIYPMEYLQEEPVECGCGLIVQRSSLLSHQNSSEHAERLP